VLFLPLVWWALCARLLNIFFLNRKERETKRNNKDEEEEKRLTNEIFPLQVIIIFSTKGRERRKRERKRQRGVWSVNNWNKRHKKGAKLDAHRHNADKKTRSHRLVRYVKPNWHIGVDFLSIVLDRFLLVDDMCSWRCSLSNLGKFSGDQSWN